MKKIILLTLLIPTVCFAQTNELTADSAYNDSKDAVKTLYEDGKSATVTVYEDLKSTYPEIKQAIESIAQGIKTTAENVWNILVRQQLVFSFAYLMVYIISIGSWIQFRKTIKNSQRDLTEQGSIKESNIMMCILLCAFAISSSVYAGFHTTDMLTGFINPEYGALKTIMQVAIEFK